jgi:hypothetical protein
MSVAHPVPPRFSQELQELAQHFAERPATLVEILAATQGRGGISFAIAHGLAVSHLHPAARSLNGVRINCSGHWDAAGPGAAAMASGTTLATGIARPVHCPNPRGGQSSGALAGSPAPSASALLARAVNLPAHWRHANDAVGVVATAAAADSSDHQFLRPDGDSARRWCNGTGRAVLLGLLRHVHGDPRVFRSSRLWRRASPR